MGMHPIRIQDPLWGQLESLAKAYGYDDGRGPHAALVRDILAAAVAEWNESPYVCKSARHSFLITAEGVVFYRQVHLLHLNSYRERLPGSISMKREKRDYFYRICPAEENPDDWFKRQWLINCFAVWQGQELDGSLLALDVDRRGTDVKSVDLLVRQDKGRVITREVLVAAKDYVQWTDGGPGSDWVEIPVDMPTRNLEVDVFVDENLYRSSSFPMNEIPPLSLEFRNRESARFAAMGITLSGESPIVEARGRIPDKRVSSRDAERAVTVLAGMKDRFDLFGSYKDEGLEILGKEERESLRRALKTPDKFLFYRMFWPAPHLGIEVCVGWEKPVRPSVPTITDRD